MRSHRGGGAGTEQEIYVRGEEREVRVTRSPPPPPADGAGTASGIGEEESGWGLDMGRPPVVAAAAAAAAAAGRGGVGGAGGAGAVFGVNSFPAKSELDASRHPFRTACLAGRQWYCSCVKT